MLLVGALASGAQAQVGESTSGTTSTSQQSSVSDSYIVTFSAGTSDSAARALLSSVDATVGSHIAPLRMYSVVLPGATASSAVATLEADPSVSRVDADQARGVATIPNDPSFSAQWALPRIGWEQARDTVTPTGSATVAILDTGVDASHPDLDGNLVPGTSILPGGSPTIDPNGHGTGMAGIVAAETGNAEGIAGVGYAGVKVMPVTVLGADGTGQDSDLIEGVVWAADHGADVILMSFSNPGYSASLQAAVDYAWSKNVVLVAATGNGSSSEPTFPAGDRGVVGVSSTGLTDSLSSTSNYGADTFLAAPGESVLSTTAGGGYAPVTGTSASAAIVAGSAALLRASSVGASNGVIVSRLARNAEPAGTADQTGNGRVDLARAIVDTSSDSVQPAGAAPVGAGGPIVGPYVVANKNLNITFAGSGGGTVAITATLTPAPSPSSCTATCSVALNNDATGTLTATPNAGSTFAGWSGTFVSPGTTTCSGTTSPCNFSMGTKEQTLTATFNGNTAPTISNIADQTINEDANTGALAFTVGDAETAASSLTVSGSSSNTTLVPNANIVFGGSGANRTVTVTPVANLFGTATITVTVSDGSLTANDTFVLTVNSVNDPPVAVDDSYSTGEDTALTVAAPGVLSNDTDQESNALTAAVVAGPAHGTLSLGANGGFTYTPAANYNGPDSFTYKANDGTADSNTATVSITVTAVDDAPVAVNDAKTVLEDAAATTIDVLANDTDIDGGPKLIASVTQPLHGAVVITNSGADLTYKPDANYCNDGTPTDNFTYTLNGGSTATVAVSVTCVQDPPTAVNDAKTVLEDAAATTIDVLANDTDVDEDTLTITAVTQGAHGSVAITNSGADLTYKPDANYNGSDSFTYTISDGNGGSDTATVTMTVTPVNDVPTVSADNATITVYEGQTAQNTGTYGDVDGDTVTLTASRGTVTKNANGTWSWSFATNDGPTQSGSVTITANDGHGGTGSASFQLAVNNLAPTITSLTASPALVAKPGASATSVVTATFTDPGTADTHTCAFTWDGASGTTPIVTESNGSGSCTSTGTFTTAGVYTVTVTVTDDDGGSANSATQATPITLMIVVYDPNAGFVTGGGWINVLPGSYAADPLLSGKANFGFQSQYKKNASVPTGETEFNFEVGKFKFHSTSYEALVVSGFKAQYFGYGTVNNALPAGCPQGYKFRLTVYDGQITGGGGVDKFRIKITTCTGAVVFDNRMGMSDDIDAADPQLIGGGQIVIHKA